VNYFERLIRRALLETPAEAGGALLDPFENEAPFSLDHPAQKPASPWPARFAAPPPAISEAAFVESLTRNETQHTVEVIAPSAPVVPLPEIESTKLPAEARTHTAVAMPAVPAPLAHADAFMRALGVAVPVGDEAPPAAITPPAIAPRTPPSPTVTPPVSRVDSQPGPAAQAEPLQPPPPPDPPPRAAREVARAPTTTVAPVHEPRSEPTAKPARAAPVPSVRETVRVVHVVEKRGGASVAQSSAVSPAFGAGQL
jgi:FHA domain-containing protein